MSTVPELRAASARRTPRRDRDATDRSRSRIASWTAVGLGLLLLGPACPREAMMPDSVLPPAETYEQPCDFSGEWLGEVDEQVGTLKITRLGEGRYRGLYEGEEIDLELVMLLEQDMIPEGGTPMASNRAVFTWQDGHGGRGEGWLLINREDSALTGASGQGGHIDQDWTFIRVE